MPIILIIWWSLNLHRCPGDYYISVLSPLPSSTAYIHTDGAHGHRGPSRITYYVDDRSEVRHFVFGYRLRHFVQRTVLLPIVTKKLGRMEKSYLSLKPTPASNSYPRWGLMLSSVWFVVPWAV